MAFKAYLKIMSLLMVFFFTACAGSEKSDTKKEDQTKLTPVSLQLQWMTQAQFAGYYVALDKGWYKEEGLDMTIYPGGPDIVAVDLVTSGTRDFGTTLLADLVVSISRNKPAVSIAQIQQNNGLRLICKKDSGIRGPSDFIGKKIGVWLGGWEVQFNALLVKSGISHENVEEVSQGFSMRPFLDGRIDVASAMIYNEYNMVIAAGIKPEEIHIIDYADYGLDFPGDVIFTSKKMMKQYPELCLKIIRASMRGWKYALENIDEAVEIVLKHDSSLIAKRDHQTKMMLEIKALIMGGEDTELGKMSPEAYEKMIKLLEQYNMIGSPLASGDVYNSEFIDQVKIEIKN